MQHRILIRAFTRGRRTPLRAFSKIVAPVRRSWVPASRFLREAARRLAPYLRISKKKSTTRRWVMEIRKKSEQESFRVKMMPNGSAFIHMTISSWAQTRGAEAILSVDIVKLTHLFITHTHAPFSTNETFHSPRLTCLTFFSVGAPNRQMSPSKPHP